jgi:DNA primase
LLRFSQQTIARVREATDFLALVRERVELRRTGQDNYSGLCPFHKEKTPSFTVSPEKGFFYCFGCHAAGDVFRYLQLAEGLAFPDAVRELARRGGVELPEEGPGDSVDLSRERRARLYEVTERASEYFESLLWDSPGLPVRNYLRGRGVSDRVIRSFRLGYSPPDWDGLAKALSGEGWDEELLLEAGLVKQRPTGGVYDLFRDRLMIPVHERDGRAVAFAGRVLGLSGAAPPQAADGEGGREPPKYVNSPATPIYSKGRLLYGFPQAAPYLEAAGCVFIVEGYFDLIALHSAGIRYAVAAMGTALTQTQADMLRGKGAEVILMFDGDRAGRDAAKRALPKLLNARLEGRAAILPLDEDPDTFLRKYGPEALMELAERSPSAFDYTAGRLLADRGDSFAGQAEALEDIRDILREVKDPAMAQLLRNRLAGAMGIDPESLPVPKREGGRQEEPAAGGPVLKEVPRRFRGGEEACGGESRRDSLDASWSLLLEHVLCHPETAPLLESLQDVWREGGGEAEALTSELMAQLKAVGSISVQRLSQRWREGRAGELAARAAVTGRRQDPETAWGSAREYVYRVLLEAKKARLRETLSLLDEALSKGDVEASGRFRAERIALQAEIRGLSETGPGGGPSTPRPV